MKKLFSILVLCLIFCYPSWAAVLSCTSSVANEDSTDNHTYAVSSHTTTAGALQVIVVDNNKGTTPDEPTSITGTGFTFQKLNTQLNVNGDQRIQLWYDLSATSHTTGLTIEYGVGNTQTHAGWVWSECTGTPGTAGNHGSEAFNSNKAGNNGNSVTSLTVTLSAFSSQANGVIAGFGNTNNAGITAGSGYTSLGNTGGASTNLRVQSQWRADNDTSVDSTSSSANAVGIAAELVAAISVPVLSDHYKRMMSFIFWRLPDLWHAGLFGF